MKSRALSLADLPMSPTVARMNAHLLTGGVTAAPEGKTFEGQLMKYARGEIGTHAPKKRLRQASAPLMNELEKRFLIILESEHPTANIRPQAKRYRLANGLWYKPDFTAIVEGREMAWECKGPKSFRGGFENLKMSATTYPEIIFTLVWEDETTGAWQRQIIIP